MKELNILPQNIIESYNVQRNEQATGESFQALLAEFKKIGANQDFFEGAVYAYDQLIQTVLQSPELPLPVVLQYCLQFFLLALEKERAETVDAEPLEEVFEAFWIPEE